MATPAARKEDTNGTNTDSEMADIDEETYQDILATFTVAGSGSGSENITTTTPNPIPPRAATNTTTTVEATYWEGDIDNVGEYVNIDTDTRKCVRRWKEGGRAIVLKKHADGSVDVKYVLTGQKEENVHPDRVHAATLDTMSRKRNRYNDHVGPSLLSCNRRPECVAAREKAKKKRS